VINVPKVQDGGMPAWLVWVIIAGAFAAAETISLAFVLVMFAGGAVGAAIAAAAGGSLLTQFVVAVVVTMALLVGFRPYAVRKLSTPLHPSGSDRLVGKEAVVLTEVTRFDGGRVRLNGAEWSARSDDPAVTMPAGTLVRVVEIHGATALVVPDNSIERGTR
jgi:membrane protein implicated in regulation of membrane protease activity